MIRKTRAFLFDFDGTLIDTMPGYADIAGRLIHQQNFAVSFEQGRKMYIDTSGIPFCQQIEIIFPRDPRNQDTVKAFESEKIEGFFAAQVDAEVRDSLAKMRKLGYIVGVSSGNYPHLIEEYVKKQNVEFDIVMGYDHEKGFEKGKPHFDHFLKTFSLPKEDLTFVGDSIKDADKGYQYGIQFIAMRGLFSDADFRLHYKDIITVGSVAELLSNL